VLPIVNIVLGAALLVSGRKLFWLFVAAGGFIAGIQFADRFLRGPEWLTLFIGIAFGIVFALLAVFLKSFAIGLAGFVLGGAILSGLAGSLGLNDGGTNWILFIIGGVLGIIFVSLLFDWALIGLSSFAGASLLVQSFNLKNPASGLAFLALIILGVVIQTSSMRKDKRKHDD